MATQRIHKDDVETKIVLDCGVDVSSATVRKIRYKKPSGSTGEWDAELEDQTKIYYVTQEGDLDETGTWTVQAYVEMPNWKGHGHEASFYVYPHI